MTPYDMIASFAISIVGGCITVTNKTFDLMLHLQKCYKNAFDK